MLPNGTAASGEYERTFFRDNTPLPDIEVLETMSLMYHGVIPAIATRDLDCLSRALGELHKVGFKKRELAAQTDQVRAMLTSLWNFQGIPAGMSSMGPLLYAIIHRDDKASVLDLKRACAAHRVTFLDAVDAWNLGHELSQL
jgi:beta-ribofuranosylaminobenzene 5'-phosphate synthase